eukprot:gene4416-5595_t
MGMGLRYSLVNARSKGFYAAIAEADKNKLQDLAQSTVSDM